MGTNGTRNMGTCLVRGNPSSIPPARGGDDTPSGGRLSL
jgi:hypothetical protein